jgi:hypothetical protein
MTSIFAKKDGIEKKNLIFAQDPDFSMAPT